MNLIVLLFWERRFSRRSCQQASKISADSSGQHPSHSCSDKLSWTGVYDLNRGIKESIKVETNYDEAAKMMGNLVEYFGEGLPLSVTLCPFNLNVPRLYW